MCLSLTWELRKQTTLQEGANMIIKIKNRSKRTVQSEFWGVKPSTENKKDKIRHHRISILNYLN